MFMSIELFGARKPGLDIVTYLSVVDLELVLVGMTPRESSEVLTVGAELFAVEESSYSGQSVVIASADIILGANVVGAPSWAADSTLICSAYHSVLCASSSSIEIGVTVPVMVDAVDDVVPTPEQVVTVEQIVAQLEVAVPALVETAQDAVHRATPDALQDEELEDWVKDWVDVGVEVGLLVGSPSPFGSGGKSPIGGKTSMVSQGGGPGGPPLMTGNSR
jgi:hypothetical protein